MKNITYPTAFFGRPFADAGNKQIIPENDPGVSGRACLTAGFPAETQLPLAQGGVAPNRLDFNGILNMLSAMAFWQQSGGQWKWSAALNYAPPCVVFHAGKLWWSLQPSGPSVEAGAQEPGEENEEYWQLFLRALAESAAGPGVSLGSPVGTVIMYYGTAAPDGYLACDGAAFSVTDYPMLYAVLGKASTPDLRGYFIRGYDTRNSVDPGGASRAIGSVQGDAIRNITGQSGHVSQFSLTGPQTGALYSTPYYVGFDGHGVSGGIVNFDASRVVPTAPENRPKNVCLLYCVKHD